MEKPKIISITLVKNEDIYIERVLNNVVDFCDEMILLDNMSEDNTYDILQNFAKNNEKVKLHRIKSFRQSGAFTKPYMSTNTWLISVDGDELYDKTGLIRMRQEILEGKFQHLWTICGYFLNCTKLDLDNQTAEGYMSPPARPCIRLYNFKAINNWVQRKHRMHGGKPIFNKGYNLDSRYDMYDKLSWEEAYLRFLHLCFIRRSSIDTRECRLNPTELIMGRKRAVSGYKSEKYKVGDLKTVSAKDFV